MPKFNQRGLTLVELLIVIAIIGIIASVVLNSLGSAKSKARDSERISDFNQIRNAVELFYATYERYPITADASTWDGRWQNFSTCLETGEGCGFATSNYVPVLNKVPQDPQDDPNTLSDSDPTYYYGLPSACGAGAAYRLAVNLEHSHPVLNNDLDGSFYNNNSGCEDSSRGYCIGTGTCAGW